MRLVVVALFIAAATSSYAAGFDCANAHSSVEKMICGDAELSLMDDEVSKGYTRALMSLADDRSQLSLKMRQRRWLDHRNECADKACISNAYVARIHEFSFNFSDFNCAAPSSDIVTLVCAATDDTKLRIVFDKK